MCLRTEAGVRATVTASMARRHCMKMSIVVILVANACAFAQAPAEARPAAPSWREVEISGSWRDVPARTIIEETAREAGLPAIFEGDSERLTDAIRVTLLSRKQPISRLLRRVGELTEMDMVVVSGRLLVYEHGRVPGILIVANELDAGGAEAPPASEEARGRRRDCEWIDLSIGAFASELSRSYGIEVTLTDDLRQRQDLVSVTGTDVSLDEAVQSVAKQLECQFGWVPGGVVIGREVPSEGRTADAAARNRGTTGDRRLRLSGDALTWEDLATLTGTHCGRDVILPDSRRNQPAGRLWADGEAMDVLIARALWEPGGMGAKITGETLALHPMGED